MHKMNGFNTLAATVASSKLVTTEEFMHRT